jgi:hypothetical protein
MGSCRFAVPSKSPLNGVGMNVPSGFRSTFVFFGRVVLRKSVFSRTWPKDVRQADFRKKNIVCVDYCSPFSCGNFFSFLSFSGYVKGDGRTLNPPLEPMWNIEPSPSVSFYGSAAAR